jgi:hypothetical protein
MAQRLATEYVKARLTLKEAEMGLFAQLFADSQIKSQIKIVENGSQEIVITAGSGEEVVFTFERRKDSYVCTGSCRLVNPKLVGAMRTAVAKYKGDAIVKRIYSHYTMMYYYERGTVVKIVEISKGSHTVIYEYRSAAEQLSHTYAKQDVEQEIESIRSQADLWLDLRNRTASTDTDRLIDDRLAALSRRLFILEA